MAKASVIDIYYIYIIYILYIYRWYIYINYIYIYINYINIYIYIYSKPPSLCTLYLQPFFIAPGWTTFLFTRPPWNLEMQYCTGLEPSQVSKPLNKTICKTNRLKSIPINSSQLNINNKKQLPLICLSIANPGRFSSKKKHPHLPWVGRRRIDRGLRLLRLETAGGCLELGKASWSNDPGDRAARRKGPQVNSGYLWQSGENLVIIWW